MFKDFIQNAAFLYFVCDKDRSDVYGKSIKFAENLYISYTHKTPCAVVGESDQIAVIGLCVDSDGSLKKEEIPSYLFKKSHSHPNELAKILKRFAGNFIVLFYKRDDDSLYAFTDATGTLPIYYSNQNNDIVLGMFDRHVAEFCGYSANKQIQYGPYNTLPYNCTPFDEVKALLPNNYIELNSKQITRIPILKFDQNRKQVTDETIRRVRNIISAYFNDYNFYCAITSGYDSRLNMAFCLDGFEKDAVCYYTINHTSYKKFDNNEILKPSEICKGEGLKYIVIDDKVLDEQVIEYVRQNLSESLTDSANHQYIESLANLAFTIKDAGIDSFLHGNIIGHIGKAGLCNDFPIEKIDGKFLAAELSYFSLFAAEQFDKWIKTVDTKENLIDFFVNESRLARWASKSITIEYLFGITTLNVYNCGYLLDLWMSVPLLKRKDRRLNLDIMKTIQPNLLKYKFYRKSVKDLIKKLPISWQKKIYYQIAYRRLKERQNEWR